MDHAVLATADILPQWIWTRICIQDVGIDYFQKEGVDHYLVGGADGVSVTPNTCGSTTSAYMRKR